MSEAKKYNPSEIELKWQDYWKEHETYKIKDVPTPSVGSAVAEKFYILDMFPYPSGEGLHVGHPKGYIATDIYSRMKRMQGFEVLHPMGFDAFGLPAEQYAIKNKLNPGVATEKNVATYKKQLEMLGLDYDWSREVNTTDPEFYKWTQWCFKQMYKAGLVSESYEPINWCPSCMTGLANEDVENGACERCSTLVEKKPIRQWSIRITDYADRLLEDLDKLDWEPHIKELQRNWIGKSIGVEIDFKINNFDQEKSLTVFTTRPDTLFGVTYLAVSAEKAQQWIGAGWQASEEVKEFISTTLVENENKVTDYKTEIEKKGIDSGITAVNPINGEEIPVWIANYVLSGYGTGAVMAVPAHDERDFEFATKYNLPIKDVILVKDNLPLIKYIYERVDAPREGIETLYRDTIDVIIENDKNEFLLLRETNNEVTHIHFVGGGIEEGDTIYETIKKEIEEETGYVDFEINLKKIYGAEIEAYRQTKNKNQFTKGFFYHTKIASERRVDSEVEDGKHEMIWVQKEKVLDMITWPAHKDAWKTFIRTNLVEVKYGTLVNSSEFDGLESEEAKLKIVEKVGGRLKSQYKLRDWVFARQRYWGEPFPIVFDENRNHYAVVDSELPVILPEVENYEPTGTGESPLAGIEAWVNVHGFINNQNEFEHLDISKFNFDASEFVDINLSGGSDNYVSGAPIVERSNVAVIIKHPNENKYLVSKWKASEWNGWLTGGIENGDSIEETVRKEVLEETGFTNIGSVRLTDFSVHGLFYHPVKKQNRLAHYRLAIVELADLDKVDVSEEEKAICDFIWTPEADVLSTLTRDEMKSLWAEYKQTGEVFVSKLKKFKRETNTMPQWAGSSWYYLRYIDPHNTEKFVDTEKEKKWSPVDFYVGGAEHATRHLIYARFWHKFLYDQGLVSQDEPFKKLQTVGLILAEDGRKMSKRWGNVVNPDDIIAEYGADTLRLYEMFMGPFDQAAKWDTKNISGSRRYLNRVWEMQYKIVNTIESIQRDSGLYKKFLVTRKKVLEDIESFKLNTAIAKLMEFQNEVDKNPGNITRGLYEDYLKLIAPFAPHITEELWLGLGNTDSIHLSKWDIQDNTDIVEAHKQTIIQINGKVKEKMNVYFGSLEDDILPLLKQNIKFASLLFNSKGEFIIENKNVIQVKDPKTGYIKLINFVV